MNSRSLHSFLFATLLAIATASAADWPWWRGSDRTGVVREASGWPDGWPPKRLWEHRVGLGCTSPIIVQGRVYVMGWAGKDGRRPQGNETGTDSLFCLDAGTGRELWHQSYTCRYQGRLRTGDTSAYGGPSATPSMDVKTDLIYTMSTDGDLRCWDTNADGKLVWARNLYDDYTVPQRPNVGGGQRDYGFPSSPLLHNGAVIVEVGADEGLVMAFAPADGKRLWASPVAEPAGHTGGPVPVKVDGVDCLALLTLQNVLVIRIDRGHEGEKVASSPWATEFACNIPTPAVAEDQVIVTSGYNHQESAMLRLSQGQLTMEWQSRRHAVVGSPVIHKGNVYMVKDSVWRLGLADGGETWHGGAFGHGSCLVTAPDDKVIAFGNGRLALLDTGADRYQELSRTDKIVRGTCYPQVTLADGILACKDRDGHLVCFSVRPRDRSAEATASHPPQQQPTPEPARPTTPQPPAPPAPAHTDGPLFAWRQGAGQEAAGRLQVRGEARMADDGSMLLTKGAYLVNGLDQALLDQCRRTGQLSIEAVITPDNIRQTGPARIISFSEDPYRRNFTLGQERDQLILRLRTPQTGENGMKPQTTLCRLDVGKPHHVIVTYSPGRLVCYVNGECVLVSDKVRGDFSNWSPMHLLFGDEWSDSRDWAGTLRSVSIESRVVDDAEAMRRFGIPSSSDTGAKTTPVPPPEKATPAPKPSPAESAPVPDVPNARSGEVPGRVSVARLDDWQGQPSFRIETPMATYVYHINGAGFASLIDRDGRDWISYRPSGGSAGSYRGIPNVNHPKGGLHPGADTCESELVDSGPDRVVIASRAKDGSLECRWTILPDYAVLDLIKVNHDYWVLYEGTPAGAYDETKAWMMDSAGQRTPCTSRWERRLPDPRWICFGTEASPRVLFLADLASRAEGTTDSFWSMQKNMTVFGFGRSLSTAKGRWFHLKELPSRFVIGFVESVNEAEVRRQVNAICVPPGSLERPQP